VFVVFIGALLLVIKFLVIPAMERGDPTAQPRALATIGALQTQEAVTRSRQALTPQPTLQPASTPGAVATTQPTPQPTTPPAAAVIAPAATQEIEARTTVSAPAVPTPASSATPLQVPIVPGTLPTQSAGGGAPAAVPTVDAVAQAEVQQAYAQYWQQRALAFRDLDPSLLVSVAAGPELAGLTNKINELRSEGRAIRTHVIHHVVALPTAPGEAVVSDEYEDLSTYVDFSTKEPLDPATADPQSGPIVKVREVLQKVDGAWKVTGGEIYE
jgi:hypothetical protein